MAGPARFVAGCPIPRVALTSIGTQKLAVRGGGLDHRAHPLDQHRHLVADLTDVAVPGGQRARFDPSPTRITAGIRAPSRRSTASRTTVEQLRGPRRQAGHAGGDGRHLIGAFDRHVFARGHQQAVGRSAYRRTPPRAATAPTRSQQPSSEPASWSATTATDVWPVPVAWTRRPRRRPLTVCDARTRSSRPRRATGRWSAFQYSSVVHKASCWILPKLGRAVYAWQLVKYDSDVLPFPPFLLNRQSS